MDDFKMKAVLTEVSVKGNGRTVQPWFDEYGERRQEEAAEMTVVLNHEGVAITVELLVEPCPTFDDLRAQMVAGVRWLTITVSEGLDDAR